MKKQTIVTLVGVGAVLASVFAVSVAGADQGGGWLSGRLANLKLEVPSGVTFSVQDGERTHALRVFRDQNGVLAHSTSNQIESGNWSGYVLAHYETGVTYTSAAGLWAVPSAAVPPGQTTGYSSSWVGIGGFCENANCTKGDSSLIQLGTESDAKTSGASYYAWYETLPQSETMIRGFAVKPGDSIAASLKLLSSARFNQTWQLSIKDVTTGATWSKNVSYRSSELSAEWIQEAPSSYSGVLPLANFGTASFDLGTVNGSTNPAFTAANEVIMLNPHGETSNPSAPDIDTDGFNACWGNGTLASCSVPTS